MTMLLEKICGAAAEDGQDLASIAALGRKVNGWGRSMGMALTSCTVPAAGKPTFELGETEMEIGIGMSTASRAVPRAARRGGRDRRTTGGARGP